MQTSTRIGLSILIAVVAALGGWAGTHTTTQVQDWQFFGIATVVTALYVALIWSRPRPAGVEYQVDAAETLDAPAREPGEPPSPRPRVKTTTRSGPA